MKRSETARMWCDKLWRTFGVCCVEVFLRMGFIFIFLDQGLSPRPENVTAMQRKIHTMVWLVVVIVLAVCFAFLCVKRGWYTQSNMRFLNIENVFFASPFLFWLCCLAYYDAWDVCGGILIASGLCLPRAISCIAYYRRKRDNGTKEKSAARWGVMIAGMAMTWAAILASLFWIAWPKGVWGKDGSQYIWPISEVLVRVGVPVLVAAICLGAEVWLKQSGVLQKSEWTVLLLQNLYCISWSGLILLIRLSDHHSSVSDWISASLVLWMLLCIAAQRITSGKVCNYLDRRQREAERPQA
ncbi:MAG: hypothetical protein SPE01_00925 [Candidatus Spyradocola sp.]|nr:hypothetical protein [Candidatus Spyradocola sp.]